MAVMLRLCEPGTDSYLPWAWMEPLAMVMVWAKSENKRLLRVTACSGTDLMTKSILMAGRVKKTQWTSGCAELTKTCWRESWAKCLRRRLQSLGTRQHKFAFDSRRNYVSTSFLATGTILPGLYALMTINYKSLRILRQNSNTACSMPKSLLRKL